MKTALNLTQPKSQTPPIDEIQEITITVAAKNLTPTMLSEDFLKFSGIIPSDWELAKEPTMNPNYAQLTFQNGLTMVAQPGLLTFTEPIRAAIQELQAPQVARQYVLKLPHAQYQALNLTPKILVPLSGDPEAARDYIAQTLLAPGPWQEVERVPVRAGISLMYPLERCQLTININEARIQPPNQEAIPALLFAGNFGYQVAEEDPHERLSQLEQHLEQWQTDWQSFKDIVNQRFLQRVEEEESVFPGLLKL